MSSSSLKTRRAVVLPFREPSWNAPFERVGCSLTPEQSEEAARLLRAVRSDLRAARLLVADAEQENDVIGFHAQQAVEKAMKAALVQSGAEIPYTHDLGFLLDALAPRESTTPESVAQADWLTPWAVAARYGSSAGSLDRNAALAVAEDAVGWATTIVEGRP